MYIVFGVLITLIVFFYVYEKYITPPPTEMENYTNFSRELQSDMDKYGISETDQKKIEALVESLVNKKKKEKNVKNIINACKIGLIRGCIIGFISGGVPGAVASGATYGVVNGFMHGVFE